MTSFTDSVDEFIDASTWISPLDAPAVTSLRAMAAVLDSGEGMTPALLSQFGLTYRSLLKRAPSSGEPEDEFEKALAEGAAI